jgi:hypothetical protein
MLGHVKPPFDQVSQLPIFVAPTNRRFPDSLPVKTAENQKRVDNSRMSFKSFARMGKPRGQGQILNLELRHFPDDFHTVEYRKSVAAATSS